MGARHAGVNWGNNWNLSFFNNIKVHGYETANTLFTTEELFNTTIHELAHSAHIKKVNSIIGVGVVDPLLRESWPEAVAQYITKIEYDELGAPTYDEPMANQFIFNRQQWQGSPSTYTPLFVDVVDNFNQHYSLSTYCVLGSGPYLSDVCYVGAPPAGATAKISPDKTFFYYTQNGMQSIPQHFIPAGANPIIRDNKYYVKKTPLSQYPNDEITGYSMVAIENSLNDIRDLSELETYLKANKPSNVTDTDIDLFLDYFYNL
jgi:hypothetical protein